MSEKFLKNLKANNLEPTYNRLDYYFLNNFVQGGESLDLDKEIIEEVEELGDTVEDYLYTTGAELSVAEVRDPESSLSVGSEYIGYYHIHEDEMEI